MKSLELEALRRKVERRVRVVSSAGNKEGAGRTRRTPPNGAVTPEGTEAVTE